MPSHAPGGVAALCPPPRIVRPRLTQRALLAPCPVTVLIGPPGAGKSDLLRPLRTDPGALYFRAGKAHATFARFVAGLARAAAAVAPGAHASFPRAWERALQSPSAGHVLAHWLAEHLQDVDRRLVIDDLHAAAADANVTAFLTRLDELRPRAGLTLAVRDPGKLPIALWMATRRLDRPIDEAELAFDRDERAALAASAGISGAPDLPALPVAAMYALDRLRTEPRAFAHGAPATSFPAVARDIAARRGERERAFLFAAALFPTLDDALLALAGWTDAAEMRAALGADAAYLWETDGDGETRYFDRSREELARAFAPADAARRRDAAERTVRALDAARRPGDALAVATEHDLRTAVGELIEQHGFALLEAGNVDAIGEALDVFERPGQTLGAAAMALRGYLDARSGRLDTSEAWFRLALERAANDVLRVKIAMYYAHELALRRRDDSGDVLAEFADCETLPADVRLDLRSAYAQALTSSGRLAEAAERTDAVVAALDDAAPDALRARVFARAAYVALECGMPDLARTRARIAAPLAVDAALFDVAASAYSVLYNIAYEVDDDTRAGIAHLTRLRDVALKSGTLRFDLYALIGLYQLHTEAGDDDELVALERRIGAADKHDATLHVLEGLIPAKAMQAAWSGGFEEALRLLRPTVDQQATPARQALCLAKIAVCEAAAGRLGAARDAVHAALAVLAAERGPSTQHERALLNLGLAAWLSGDAAAAEARLADATALSLRTAPRVQAFRDTLSALIERANGAPGADARLSAALARLRACAYAGMARLVEALPDPYRGGTIGAALGDGAAGPRVQFAGAPSYVRFVDDVDAAIETLFIDLDAAAPLMAEHSRAVSAWCSRVARLLGLSEREVEFVTRGGLIHDIGKIRTPAEILNAPRALDAREWAIMQDHAAAGARIVATHAPLLPFVPVVRGHHERLDGRGYPDGLRGTSIPLAARIVTVADSFNAMIGRRAYRLPMAPTDALEELQRHRGTQFDPEVVDALTHIVLGRFAGEPPAPDDRATAAADAEPV